MCFFSKLQINLSILVSILIWKFQKFQKSIFYCNLYLGPMTMVYLVSNFRLTYKLKLYDVVWHYNRHMVKISYSW